MKKYNTSVISIILILATALFSFIGCSDMMEKLGNISLTIILDTPNVEVASYGLEGLHTNSASRFILSDITPPRHSLSALEKGSWDITVVAFDDAGSQIGIGTKRVDLKEGQRVETTLLVVFTQAVPSSSLFSVSAPSRYDSSDGEIAGTTQRMEYKLASSPEESSYTACIDGTTILGSGTYLVRYAAAHGLVASEPLAVTVPQYQPIQLTIDNPTLTMTNKPYDGTTVFIGTVTPGTLAGIQGSDEITINAHASYDTAAVGTDKTITVTYTLGGTDAGNYIKPVDTTQVATISKKQVAISGTTITETKVYDGTNSIEVISLGVIEGVLGSDQVSVTATATYDDISAGVDKPITIRYSLQGENAGNYQISDDTSRKASITKATYDMSGITFNDYTVTYDGNQKRLSITGELPSGVEVFYTNNAKTNVGEYQVTASFTGDSTNYEAIADRSATLTIEKAPMTGSVSITGTALNGEVLTAVPVLTNTGTLTYQWNRGETAISGATGNTYVLVSADIGFTITVTATAGGLNYQGSITSSATAPVKDPDVVAISTDIAALAFDDFNFISGDTSTSVRNSFSVPGNGDNGTTISWQEVSDSESVISINSGTVEVKRPFGNDDNDASVTIRAIVSKGTAAPQTKDFTLTVLDVILMGQSTYGYRLAMNQSIGDIFYLEGDYSTIAGVHTLRNGSVEWETLISTGLPNGSKTANYGSSIASDSAGTVYVLTKVDDINTKIYSLADGAATWTQVGNEDFAAGKSQTGNTGKIVVDSLGKPYAMVNIGFGFKVFELVDTVWSDISPVATSYKSDLFADGPDLYYVTYNYSGGGFVVYKRSSNTWSQIASGIDITGDRNAYPSISAFGNIVTLAVAQANDSVKVMRYDGENWTELSNLMPNIAVNQGTNAHMQSLTVGTTSYIVAFEVVGTDFGTVSRYENGAWTGIHTFKKSTGPGIHAVYDSANEKIVVLNTMVKDGTWEIHSVMP